MERKVAQLEIFVNLPYTGIIVGALLGGGAYALRDYIYRITDPEMRKKNIIFGALLGSLLGGGGEYLYRIINE